mmetsp:Transcript_92308/g.160334  ORF Transcript_92308/g.160334 Transcript_92308/m.160334 type:complete len:204 (+) Transcript_92308:934-1545(+)
MFQLTAGCKTCSRCLLLREDICAWLVLRRLCKAPGFRNCPSLVAFNCDCCVWHIQGRSDAILKDTVLPCSLGPVLEPLKVWDVENTPDQLTFQLRCWDGHSRNDGVCIDRDISVVPKYHHEPVVLRSFNWDIDSKNKDNFISDFQMHLGHGNQNLSRIIRIFHTLESGRCPNCYGSEKISTKQCVSGRHSDINSGIATFRDDL